MCSDNSQRLATIPKSSVRLATKMMSVCGLLNFMGLTTFELVDILNRACTA
jgi:hypothetical protein